MYSKTCYTIEIQHGLTYLIVHDPCFEPVLVFLILKNHELLIMLSKIQFLFFNWKRLQKNDFKGGKYRN